MTFAVAVAVLLGMLVSGCGESGDSTLGTPGDSSAGPGESAPAKPKGSSGDFTVPGGDNSIQNFGKEAAAAEREEASAALQEFMAARARDDWRVVCSHLDQATTKPLEQFSESSPGGGKSCAAIFAGIAERLTHADLANTMTGPIDSFRVEADHGFALYHGTGGVDYFVPMSDEGGWKVAALEPTAFP